LALRGSKEDKPLVWLRGEIKTPPFSQAGRLEAGYLLRYCNKERRWGFRIHGPCRPSERDVTSYESMMRLASLEFFTVKKLTPLSFWMSF
jgi:hypothetical protein